MNIFTVLLTEPLANGLILFYKILGENLGIAIIVFSLFLRILMLPLTNPYMESMKKMKKYSKELEKLKEKHKGDRTKLMQAQADFYKQHGINPSAGCLPYILQIVVLLALFRLFTVVLSANGDTITKINELLYKPLQFAADDTLNTHFLFWDITQKNTFTLPGIPFALPGVLVILAALVQFVSAKMSVPYLETEKKIAKKTESQSDDIQVAMQSSMIYTFPLITLVAGMSFPAGLALYWLLFSLFQMYQQYRSAGWGGVTPWLKKVGLLKLADSNKK